MANERMKSDADEWYAMQQGYGTALLPKGIFKFIYPLDSEGKNPGDERGAFTKEASVIDNMIRDRSLRGGLRDISPYSFQHPAYRENEDRYRRNVQQNVERVKANEERDRAEQALIRALREAELNGMTKQKQKMIWQLEDDFKEKDRAKRSRMEIAEETQKQLSR